MENLPDKKHCSQCKQWLEFSKFHKNRNGKYGLGHTCKSCDIARQRAKRKPFYRPLKDVEQTGGRVCTQCGKWKPASDFSKDANRLISLTSNCKSCRNETRRALRQLTAYLKRFLNPRINLLDRKHLKRLRDRARYAKYRDKMLANGRKWWKQWYSNPKHKAIHAARCSSRRSRVLGNGGKFTAEEWIALCKQFGNVCLCCGRDDVTLTVDHIVPIARGGTSNIDNLQPLCDHCNKQKNTKTKDYRNYKDDFDSGR